MRILHYAKHSTWETMTGRPQAYYTVIMLVVVQLLVDPDDPK